MPVAEVVPAVQAVALEARRGLTVSPRSLSPWLFYDELGSQLFERITECPEYYLTRTERAILETQSESILDEFPGEMTVAELGAGTATKTGVLLRAVTARQGRVLYQPIDVSATSLDEARETLEGTIAGVTVQPQIANYITETFRVERPAGTRVLALYIGSSIGNFSPEEARTILENLRAQLRVGDGLLLGTDLAPGRHKPVERLLAAYDDRAGVTAAFNRNVLMRLNREIGADFDLSCFRHEARWNAAESRMEMHLVSVGRQVVRIPGNGAGGALRLEFAAGETIHTENSYKFTEGAIGRLLEEAGFVTAKTFRDKGGLFAVTLAMVSGG